MLSSLLVALAALAAEPPDAILHRYGAAVVKIIVVSVARKEATAGTGFFTSPDGEMVTNLHVFRSATLDPDAHVEFTLADGRKITKFLVGRCTPVDHMDYCLLKLDVEPRKWLRPVWDLPSEGQPVYAMGNALNKGIIAKGGKFVGTLMLESVGEVQVSIPFVVGMSGGAIVTADGELVGMTTRWITEWNGYEPTVRDDNFETSLGLSTRELQKQRKKVTDFLPPRSYFKKR
jgi:S1-C subfamily serine protease